jgi:hypothetical protein
MKKYYIKNPSNFRGTGLPKDKTIPIQIICPSILLP